MKPEEWDDFLAAHLDGETVPGAPSADKLDEAQWEEILDLAQLDGLLKHHLRTDDAEGFAKAVGFRLDAERTRTTFARRVEERLPGRRGGTFALAGLLTAAAALLIVWLSATTPPTPSTGPIRTASKPLPSAPDAPPKPAPPPQPVPDMPRPVNVAPPREAPRAPEPEKPAPAKTPEKETEPRRAADPTPPTPAPPAPPALPERPTTTVVARLEPQRGEAFVARGPERSPVKVAHGLVSGQGVEIRGATGRARIIFPDATRLQAWGDTTVTAISEDPPAGKRVVVREGNVTAEVVRQPEGRPLVMATPHGEVTVLGTTLRVLIDPGDKGSTRVEVTEGKVQLRRFSDGKTVEVASGHFAVAATGTDLVARALPRAGRPRNLNLLGLGDNTWLQVGADAPAKQGVRWMADARNRLFFAYGGMPDTNEGWTFDLGEEQWSRRDPHEPGISGRPGAGGGRGLAFDSRRGLVWVLGGTTNLQNQDLGLWAYDGGTRKWSRPASRGEPRQSCNCMVYDGLNDTLITVGSGSPGVWVYSIAKQSWRGYEEASGPARGGPESVYRAMTFDPDLGQAVFFTGPVGGKGETWAYDVRANRWRKLNPRVEPPGRMFAGMTYDSANKVHLLFGGSTGDAAPKTLYNDLWAYDARTNSWTEMRPPNPPGKDLEHLMFAYDEEHHVALLAHPTLGLWAYRYRNLKGSGK